MARMRISQGPAEGQFVDVDVEMTVGRGNTDFAIDDRQLSRRHAVLRPAGDGVEVEDLESLNGTFVEGVRVSGPVTVQPGKSIRMGQTVLEVEVAEVADKTVVDEPPQTGEETVLDAPPPSETPSSLENLPPPPSPAEAAPPAEAQPAAPQPPAPPPLAVPPDNAPAAGQPGAPLPAFGALSGQASAAPARRRPGAAASRLWLAAALSIAIIVATAIVLVIYFAAR